MKQTLSEEEANEFLIIQSHISTEIQEETNFWLKENLINKSEYSAESLIFCMAKNHRNQCIGYGYGNIDFKERDSFYLNTIGVLPDYRRNGIGTQIKLKLIQHAFENHSNIKSIKTITQLNNNATITINNKIGFKEVK
ncbi:GNAT family N-acetyltransferase [Lacinutrix himadriensis]|uniref:GNAT family N-acetyltransferase n=1 Tax=Lacinutrix himadriensis TaxID=641549 RepID=UPI0013791F19|nr:GNAT family N-acetyltransferase [Lacinutrix himadriensis]